MSEQDNVASRVLAERTARSWSQRRLSELMTEHGCALDASAIQKIEGGTPRRRSITVDELVGFSKVFGLSLEDLLSPTEIQRDLRLEALVGQLRSKQEPLLEAAREFTAIAQDIAVHVGSADLLTHAQEARTRVGSYVMVLTHMATQLGACARPRAAPQGAD